MRSSTSDSEPQKASWAIIVLLAGLLVYVCALEVVTRVGFARVNHVWRLIQADRRQAVTLRPASVHESVTILIVGNSYLEVGVNRDNLQQEMSPAYSVTYLPVSGTSYLDWYFGLRRIFAEGAHPTVIGVCLSTRDLMSDATSGESFAHTLMLWREVLRVKTDSHLDNTGASDYFFAHFSGWLGHRAEIRNWLLRKSLANANDFAQHLRPQNQPLPPAENILAKTLPRLRALNQLCNENGSRFFLLIPPSRDVRDASAEVRAAATREGIMVVLPFQHAELPETAFVDGSHLNPKGAALFTERLGPTLLQSLLQD